MSGFEWLTSWIANFPSYAIPFLFVLTIIVFFHELGHFLVARWCGVSVSVFSVGFGRELIGWTDRKGTRWKLSLLPLGGYVAFEGDTSAASTPDREAVARAEASGRTDLFHSKPVGQRAAIVAAGPIANFLLAIVIFAAVFMFVGRESMLPRIDEITPNSAAAAAGLQVGDIVKSVDGREVASFSELQRIVSQSAGQPLTIVVERGGQLVSVTAVPKSEEVKDNLGGTHRIGLLGVKRNNPKEGVRVERYGPLEALRLGVSETWYVAERSLVYLARVIVGRESANQLGGPLRIAQISGVAASIGFATLMNLAAVLSVSIGLINLFPIPLLDGGHLLYYAIEAIRGRPLSARMQDFGYRIGLAVVLMLMLFATWNDLIHWPSF